MTSWFILTHILLLLSSSLLQARYRAHSKGRYSMSTQPLVRPFPENDNNLHGKNNKDSWNNLINQAPSTTPSIAQYSANDEQIEQFTRLLIERLNLKETPNVTVNVNDDTGFPSSIFKQLEQQTKEQQRLYEYEENSYRQQKLQDDTMATAERAILPGNFIPNNTCQQQLSVKFKLNDNNLQNIDCFRFTKSSKESKSLPTNQMINELRLYIKRNYFHLNQQQQDKLTPDMFQIYQIFRPTSNDTLNNPPPGLTGTIRIPISQVKELNGNWFELTVEPNNEDINIQQLYKQLIMPWFALAIDRNLQTSPSSTMTRSLPSYNHRYYRQYHSKKYLSHSSRSQNIEENNKEFQQQQQQQLPYMLVEYGDKIYPSSSGRRGTRDVVARPAHGCHPTSSCCRRSLTIDLDRGTNPLNFIIYPRQLDIGECIGLCGISGSSLKHVDVKNAQHRNEQHSTYNLFLLQSGLHFNKNSTATEKYRQDQHSPQCCSYSRTSGLEIMYTTTNGGPIIRKFIPDMVVEECKCGLPATIQQV